MKAFACLFACGALGLWACGSDRADAPAPSADAGGDAADGGTSTPDAAADVDATPAPPECPTDTHQWAPCATDKAQCTQTCTVCGAGMFTRDPIVFLCQPDPASGNALEWTTFDEVDCFPETGHCQDVYTDSSCTQPLVCD